MQASPFYAQRSLPLLAQIADATGTDADAAIAWAALHGDAIEARLKRNTGSGLTFDMAVHRGRGVSGRRFVAGKSFRANCLTQDNINL